MLEDFPFNAIEIGAMIPRETSVFSIPGVLDQRMDVI
jgi:hypothetical protein